ncbi:MAG TPA: gluconate 2-dehydrogenase subunit 3 family protein [Longimicrobiales bacterium]|nr:gluconate 2-dehydrogenase subunit 3 family protein [Longimicrobiales bacterium]
MSERLNSRREFLALSGAAGAAFLLADAADVREALAWAASRRGQQSYTNLSARQGATLEAAVARILPSDDGTPGAREAGVIHFIDRAIGGFGAGAKPAFEQCAAELDRRAAEVDASQTFDALSPERQDGLLRAIEQEPYFGTLRTFTAGGMFAMPSYGGNRDHVGWTLIGQGREPLYTAPFGYYDAQAAGGGQ